MVALFGDSQPILQLRQLMAACASSDASVLINGETGSGKEVVCRELHRLSRRSQRPFVAINCAAIPATLLESELFGYRKGAYTGATTDQRGRLEAAHGGTLFLDEIGDLPLLMQSKLLRAIQERSVRPLGATAEVASNARIVSATHRDLAADVQAMLERIESSTSSPPAPVKGTRRRNASTLARRRVCRSGGRRRQRRTRSASGRSSVMAFRAAAGPAPIALRG